MIEVMLFAVWTALLAVAINLGRIAKVLEKAEQRCISPH